LRAFGKYSYGIYVLHPPVQAALGSYATVFAIWVAGGTGAIENVLGLLVMFVLLTAASFSVAFAVYNVLERPFLRLKRFFEYKPTQDKQLLVQVR
jgi:peptidoglycan/LPS O-acetylase OafA/YrhL